MRELIGKIPTRDPNITEVVYLAEIVLCLECQQTVPMGIEVVTVKKSGSPSRLSGKRATAADMVLITKRKRKSPPICPHARSEKPLLRFRNSAWGMI